MKVIDFGTAKHIVDRTATIIGTPHYMAPEVILGEGYTFSIDYWSIGISKLNKLYACTNSFAEEYLSEKQQRTQWRSIWRLLTSISVLT